MHNEMAKIFRSLNNNVITLRAMVDHYDETGEIGPHQRAKMTRVYREACELWEYSSRRQGLPYSLWARQAHEIVALLEGSGLT